MLSTWTEKLKRFEQDIIEQRRYLHQHPELSFQERETAAFIAEELKKLGLEVRTGVGGNGVLGILQGKRPGRTLAFRADFDALPIQDEKTAPYRSTVAGVMHACGHDGHTAVLLGVAHVLSEHRDDIGGRLVFIFQHAEEKPPGGAAAMIAAGCLEGVEAIYGIHLSTEFPLGRIGICEGNAMASVDAFAIDIQGKGGHGGRPHHTVDSIAVGGQLITGLQQIVSRKVNPLQPAVVSIGMFHAGTAFNVIADKARLEGTVRSYDEQTRNQIESEIKSVAAGISEAFGASSTVHYERGYPPLVNSKPEADRVRKLVGSHFGADAFRELPPVMGAEDFAWYLTKIPGAFIHVGARNEEERTQFPHHHPQFDFDERALLLAGSVFLALAAEYLA